MDLYRFCTEPLQTYQFTQGCTILYRLQVHLLTIAFIIHNKYISTLCLYTYIFVLYRFCTEPLQTYQFTQGCTILYRLQVHLLTIAFIIHNKYISTLCLYTYIFVLYRFCTEPLQTYQFTQGCTILYRLQVHLLTIAFIIHNKYISTLCLYTYIFVLITTPFIKMTQLI